MSGPCVTVKPLRCKHCDFETTLITKVDEEGLAVQSGWTALREHWDKEHLVEAAALDTWIYGSTEHKAPDWLENEEQCLG